MNIIYILLPIIISIQSRVYEDMYRIKSNLFPKFKDMSIKFEIPIKNAYYYQFESTNIIYAFTKYYIDDFGSRIILSNQPMELIFNLSFYEKCDEMFDFYSDKLIYSELIRVGVTFYVLKFYQAKRDFSFNLTYKIEDLDNDVDIFFYYMKNVNVFNYLLFEDKNESFDNKNLYDFMKLKIVENLIKGMRKILIIYPECDALYHFNSLIDAFTDKIIKIDHVVTYINYYRAIINYFEYENINKINDIILYEKITSKITLIYYFDQGIGSEEDEDKYEPHILKFEYLSINKNFKIEFGNLISGESYAFNILKQIISSFEL